MFLFGAVKMALHYYFTCTALHHFHKIFFKKKKILRHQSLVYLLHVPIVNSNNK